MLYYSSVQLPIDSFQFIPPESTLLQRTLLQKDQNRSLRAKAAPSLVQRANRGPLARPENHALLAAFQSFATFHLF